MKCAKRKIATTNQVMDDLEPFLLSDSNVIDIDSDID